MKTLKVKPLEAEILWEGKSRSDTAQARIRKLHNAPGDPLIIEAKADGLPWAEILSPEGREHVLSIALLQLVSALRKW